MSEEEKASEDRVIRVVKDAVDVLSSGPVVIPHEIKVWVRPDKKGMFRLSYKETLDLSGVSPKEAEQCIKQTLVLIRQACDAGMMESVSAKKHRRWPEVRTVQISTETKGLAINVCMVAIGELYTLAGHQGGGRTSLPRSPDVDRNSGRNGNPKTGTATTLPGSPMKNRNPSVEPWEDVR